LLGEARPNRGDAYDFVGHNRWRNDGSRGIKGRRCHCGRQFRQAARRSQDSRARSVGEARRDRGVSPSRPFILRPVATSLLMAAILLVGIAGYQQLPVSALPEVDYPTIQVLTFFPG